MRNEFDYKEHIGEAIHCKTIKEAKDFARYCDKHNIHWYIDDKKVSDELLWRVHRENTCYCFEYSHSISYSRIGYFKDNNYKIIEWRDYMNTKNEFTKADLKSGDVIIRKNGDIQIVCLETDTLIDKTGYDTISDFDDDMTYKYDKDGNNDGCIIKVYRPQNPYQCSFDLDAFIDGELVYYRNSNVIEMTIAEIEKALGIENLKVVK